MYLINTKKFSSIVVLLILFQFAHSQSKLDSLQHLKEVDATARMNLLDVIEDRYGKKSTIITSQIPVKEWYDVIGEKTVADAVLDRLVHQSLRVELYGESLRKQKVNDEYK